jgi:hypothetical protein
MRSGGGSFGRLSLHLGEDWWTFLSTYDDHPPILDVNAGSTSVSFSIAGREVTHAVMEFGRELAAQAAQFAAELERLYAIQDPAPGNGNDGAPAAGEAA